MTEEKASATTGKAKIRQLNANDVLLGRGPGLSQFEGNLKFRVLVDRRKEEYTTTTNRKEKKRIAKEVVDIVHSRGGRFLKQEGSVDFSCAWYEADLETSMEKTKQALRELRDPIGETTPTANNNGIQQNRVSGNSTGSSGGVSERETTASPPAEAQATASGDGIEAPTSVPGTFTASPPDYSSELNLPCTLDPRLLLFREAAPLFFQPQLTIPQLIEPAPAAVLPSPLLTSSGSLPPDLQADVSHLISMNIAATVAHQRYLADNAIHSMLRNFALLQTQARVVAADKSAKRALEEKIAESLIVRQEENGVNTTQVAKLAALKEAPKEEGQSNHTEDEVVAAFLLSSLAIVDRPVMTEEEEELERAAMTDEERASILADAFGDMCQVSSHQSKKSKRDLDETSIAFLVRQMVLEIENIPMDKKEALTEALSSGRVEDFSDERLEKFLRCEGMNTKLAAERFVRYWENRREVFGRDKFLLPMTLGGALRDDLVALKTCVYTLLPHPDASGRQLLYMEPHRHTREGYTSESMLRAIWYVSEITSYQNKDASSGIVQVCWFKNSSIWDYDLIIFDRWAYFLNNCWPIKVIANHLCCPTKIVLRIVKPIIHTFVSMEFRARTLAHDVPDTEILQVLANYGISKANLPSEMGGSLTGHQLEWMANRWAAELEEI